MNYGASSNIINYDLTNEILKGEKLATFWRQKAMAAAGRMMARKTKWKPWQEEMASFLDISPFVLNGLKRNSGFNRKVTQISIK